jgi:hypothetical protein
VYPHASWFTQYKKVPGLIAATEAYLFAKVFGDKEDVDVKKLQRIVINERVPNLWYKFARDIEGANINKIQNLVIRYGMASTMNRFSLNVPKADKEKLEAFMLIKEVMEM